MTALLDYPISELTAKEVGRSLFCHVIDGQAVRSGGVGVEGERGYDPVVLLGAPDRDSAPPRVPERLSLAH